MAEPSSRRHVAAEIRKLLEQQESVYCDACLALRLSVSLLEAREAALRVAGEPGFVQRRDTCDSCTRIVDLTAVAVRLRRRV